MSNNAAPKLETHPPLARDSFGNLLALPEGTAAWRVCCETTGRPREIRRNRQAVRFPLDTTTEDLLELCGAGIYRIYALDEVGTQLDDEHVAKWDLTPGARDHRNGTPEMSLLATSRSGSGAGPTDLRFALEAMTHMMRTNSEALRIVADSHVDLAKTIVAAKGLRNASMLAFAPAPDPGDDTDDIDHDETRPPPKSHPVVELLMPLAQKAAEIVPGFVLGKVMGGGATTGAPKSLATGEAAPPSADSDLASRGFEFRDLIDLPYAKRKGDAKRAAKEQHATQSNALASLQARIVADPTLVQQLFSIKAQLAADEIDTLMRAIANTSEETQLQFLASIKDMPCELAVESCRVLVNDIRSAATP